jgi:glycosyltransferase involved in cell wall biosynthesis
MSRIVWFHPRQLFPPRGGGDHRSAGLVRGALAAGHEVLLVQPYDGLPRDAPPAGLQVVDLTPRQGAANAVAKVVERAPLRAPRLTRASMTRARRRIAAFAPDLGVVSEIMTWGLAEPLLPAGVPWISDAQNVEPELFRSHLASASSALERLTFRVDLHRVARTERALLRHSSAVVAVSAADADGLRAVDPTHEPVLVPSSMLPPDTALDPSLAGPVALFVGSLDFPPNIEAIDILVEELMPRVVALCPQARLLVVGRRPSARMRQQLASRPWVEFLEDAPTMADAYARARCVLMPFRSGSGTKLKLYEAMAFGLPVVATSKGVAGVDLVDGQEVLVSDDLDALAVAAARLLDDPDAARRLGAASRRTFEDRLSWERAAYPPLTRLIADLT